MTFYSKLRKTGNDEDDWSSYVENIYYMTDSNRLYYISMLDGKCRSCYKDFYFNNIPEISKDMVIEYLKYTLKSLQSDYFKAMAKANNLDDTDTIKRLKRVLKRLSSD